MRFWIFCFLVLLGFGSNSRAWGKPISEEGEKLFAKHCAECHGIGGEGVEEEYAKPLVGDWPIQKLIGYVDETMPDYDPSLVKSKEAEAVARFIFESFYRKPELFQKDTRIQLARLTNRQFRQSVTDLFSAFEGSSDLSQAEHGLKGRYYNSEGMNKRKDMHAERVDLILSHDFKNLAPYDGMNAKKFSVYWDGSLLPRESGWYEFFVRTPNGFEFKVNQHDGTPTIDEKVSPGQMREVSAKIFLLGGRPYPLELEFYKFNDPNASIELSWITPAGVKEIIPSEFLFTKEVPPSFVSQWKLPPDDSSNGYERGIQIDSTWDESITYAALEAAKFAGDKIDRLAKTNDDDSEQERKIREIGANFVRLAFRENLTEKELETYVYSKFQKNLPLHLSVEKVVLLALKSPRFLYPEWQALAKRRADPRVVASRLALYMWDSIPDFHLHKQIEKGHFQNKGQIEGQAKRMLRDPRSKAKFTDFLLQWLDIRGKELPSFRKETFPEFSPALAMDLRRSLLRSIDRTVWQEQGNWQDFLRLSTIEITHSIAKYYQIPLADKPNSIGYVPVEAASFGRQGIHTHPYILASHSYPANSSPIHRGVFTTRKILGRTLRPPQEAISFSNADFSPDWTMRQKVTNLTKPANCMSCHDLINSTGFVLEGFDATGRARSSIADKPIDLLVNYLDENGNQREFTGPQDLLAHALESQRSAKSFVEDLFKHLAKQSLDSYSNINVNELSDMLLNGKLNLANLYLEVCLRAATEGFAYRD